MTNDKKSTYIVMASMIIWGTIGLFVKGIDLPSSFISLARGAIGALVLFIFVILSGKKLDKKEIKANLPILLISGAVIGLNWAFLFESYNYTTVAVSTLCYYMSPVIVILTSPFTLKEKLTGFDIICTLAALVGMIFITISDTKSATFSFLGIMYGLLAALGYAVSFTLNVKMKQIGNMEKTIVQLIVATAVMVVYSLFNDGFNILSCDAKGWMLLLVVGIIHTGIAYYLYFGALGKVNASKAAIASYIDPLVATLCSVLILRESMNVFTVIGALLILGSSVIHTVRQNSIS